MKALFDRSEDITSDIRTFWFKPAQPLRYTAGQFTEITLPHKEVDDRGIKRWFTLSSAPGGELVSITTRRAHEHSSSFKKALWAMQPGHEVDLAEAMGDFVLSKLTQTPLIFVAGGIGITPFHSIAEWLKDTKEERPIRLLHAVRTEDDIIFQNTFDAAGIKETIVVSEPSETWGGVRGRLDAETILGLEKPDDDTLIYLSGPEPMLEALENDLLKHGVAKRQLVTDFFPGYTSL
jgi:ferredoxin-NADP reductase